MRVNTRRCLRHKARVAYSIRWQDGNGLTKSAQVQGLDSSDGGIGFEFSGELLPGTTVFIEGPDGHPSGYGVIRHHTLRDDGHVIGLELSEKSRRTVAPPEENITDYYAFLQISPTAELPTIERVHRFLAARYHPDNAETGDQEKFLLLQKAFETLACPVRRAEYDLSRQPGEDRPSPMSATVDFMDDLQGEMNRRLALMSVLYSKRRSDPEHPEVSLWEVEERMGFPRDYLQFTIWYLKNKKYASMGDNGALTLTVLGVDFVESSRVSVPILNKLLTSGSGAAPRSGAAAGYEALELSEQALLVSGGDGAE
jgi:hypothetical protein